ncbi:hypothetical protein Bca52824_086618 [Brassica carinata]|uniref:Uncharacterized protein n=1 Tax=Brassica carinata TaxID=52824 RepID=A0A8X7TM15_BRACI|nr:hypothetical protein Bca52824_086618 [Brassica carinata]
MDLFTETSLLYLRRILEGFGAEIIYITLCYPTIMSSRRRGVRRYTLVKGEKLCTRIDTTDSSTRDSPEMIFPLNPAGAPYSV